LAFLDPPEHIGPRYLGFSESFFYPVSKKFEEIFIGKPKINENQGISAHGPCQESQKVNQDNQVILMLVIKLESYERNKIQNIKNKGKDRIIDAIMDKGPGNNCQEFKLGSVKDISCHME
jgi:hypothetical protein